METKKLVSLMVAIAIGLTAWCVPISWFGIPELTIVEQRVIALFLLAASLWITEAIPIWSTSVLTIVLMLLTVSNRSFILFQQVPDGEQLGTLINSKSIMATFADPIIMLFLGGFVLAIAATKVGLDANLARTLLKPFGTKPKYVLLGFISVTAIFSAFMSNTATAAMMLTILAPILRELPANGKGKIGMALAIPVAANVGGMETPIGTPPNAIALKFMNDPDGLNMGIGFGEWSAVMIPYVIIILFLSWQLLLRLFPFSTDKIEIEIEGAYKKDTKSIIVYVTFAVTVVLWMLDKVTGLDANVVALIPVAVFCVTGILTKDDLRDISWDVLWLVAGGFALGVGLSDTGLAQHMISAIPFDTWSPMLVIIGSGFLCCLMSEFMSNTATSALLMPILAAVGVGMGDSLTPLGGMSSLLVGIAMSASLAMALPISTPPNALAHSTGLTQQKDMAKVGIIVGIMGMIIGYGLLFALGRIHWFN